MSQTLVVSAWADAKFGTVANSIVLATVVLGYGSWRFDATSREEFKTLLAQAMPSKAMLTRESLEGLPAPVQTWLRRSNVVG